MKPDTRIGTCTWCGRHNAELVFVVWLFDGRILTDWVCERCRRILRKRTVNENED